MQNIKVNAFAPSLGGLPAVTLADSMLAGAGSDPRHYLAARLVVAGDATDATVLALCHHLYMGVADMVPVKGWDIPVGSEVYRLLSDLSVAEHLHPAWFKNDRQRVLFFNHLSRTLGPKAPLHMTIDKWKKKWGARYKAIFAELLAWADAHLQRVADRLN